MRALPLVDFRALFEEAADPMLLVDEDRVVVWQNAQARTLFGETPPANTCGQLLSCQGRRGRSLLDSHACYGRCALAKGKSLPSVNMSVSRKDGTRVPVSASYTYFPTPEGTRLLITLRDLSGQLRWLDREIQRTRRAAEQSERQRVAREFHDGLGQSLTTLHIMARLVTQKAEQGDLPAVQSTAAVLLRAAEEARREMRAAVQALRQPRAVEIGEVVEEALATVGDWTGLQHAVVRKLDDVFVPAALRHEVFQIVREALTNVVRHAKARHVVVRLQRRSGRVLLSVEDDGVGPKGCLRQGKDHYGLLFMRERARAIGGELRVLRNRAGGTTVRLSFPLPAAPLDAEAPEASAGS